MKLALFRTTTLVALMFAFTPMAHAEGPSCSSVFSKAQNTPMLSNIYRAMESLTQVSAKERDLFYYDSWGIDFLKNNDYGTAERIADSYRKPQPIYNKKGTMDGGMVLYQGHIFVDGYFRDQRGAIVEKSVSTKDLAQRQVWFRWDGEKSTYTKEYGNTQLALMAKALKKGKGQATVYRGLSESEAVLLQKLKNGDQSALKDLLTQEKDALFFSTDIKAAKMWSNGYYVALKLDPAMLEKSYVGIEYDYVEIAIYDPQVLQQAVSTMVVEAYVKPPPAKQRKVNWGF